MSEGISRNDYAEAIVLEYVRTRRPELREKIVESYRDLVHRVARRYAGIELVEDLAQVGFTGLLNALGMYEPSKGVRFNTYATHLVAGSIKHYLRDRARIIREPAWLQEVRHKVNRMAAQIQQESGKPPTAELIAERTLVPVETVREVLATDDLFRVTSLSSSAGSDDEDSEELDLAGDDQEQLSVEDRMVLESALGELRELEQQVLYLFHFESLNQTEISSKLKISGNYVSHILRQSLTKLRQKLADEERRDLVLQRQANALQNDIMDAETGVYSETHVTSLLNEACTRAACAGEQVTLMRIEFSGLDRFGSFYGPDAVSAFLADAARFLRESVRRLDVVGRIGTQGFGIILPGTGDRGNAISSRVVNRLIAWAERTNLAGSGVAISLGVSTYPEAGRNAASLVRAASLHPLSTDWAA